MLEIFSYIIICIATIWTLVSFAGYLFYKTQHLDSWTDGLKDVFNTGKSIMSIIGKGVVSCMQFCYTELTGKLPDGQIINPTLMLTNKEAIELTNRFKGCPYDMPFLEQFLPNCNGILWMEIVSAGLCASYENLSFSDLKRISISTIGNFYYEIKGINVPIYVKVAQKDRLYFAIPLCTDGETFLQKQEQFQIKNPVGIVLPKKTSNILIAGKSGSGKSLSARWYLWQLLHNQESLVYIADYKAGEELPFEGLSSYASGEKAFDMINDFYQFFTEVRSRKLRLQQHYTLFIEEWFGLLTYAENQSKKLKTELMAKISELLSVARGLNIGVIIALQRADASLFNSGAREQFQCVCSFGRCSSEQFRMLGFNGELESNPTSRYGAGEALALIDGQESIKEIKVPFIKNEEVLCDQIRHHLHHQPSLPKLIRAVAGGESTEQ